MGLEIPLHVIRAESVEQFVNSLREHANREMMTLYPATQILPKASCLI